MTICTHCGRPARWRADGEPVCGSHATDAALRGRRVELLPALDVVDRLEDEICWSEGEPMGEIDRLHFLAAAEIRRLRARVAELEAGQTAAG